MMLIAGGVRSRIVRVYAWKPVLAYTLEGGGGGGGTVYIEHMVLYQTSTSLSLYSGKTDPVLQSDTNHLLRRAPMGEVRVLMTR